ncbi:DUF7332 family protein [Halorubrum ezzemoulense]|uniref:DUF7332 family protein n=1 Tax=Halorubrum ezzemoulense TaxID=337243 RepID=UPI00232CBFD1|nr:hypothetical protein [Halorubrum ezzemoulense]MDB2237253.1 hypothetical protein [Halorubrum ezzemoulense]MDB2246797.1 hypothetical protein [Halorubrum ezzemoulense]
MTRPAGTRVRSLAFVLLLLLATVGAGAAAGQPAVSEHAAGSETVVRLAAAGAHASVAGAAGGPGTVGAEANASGSRVGPITRCFAGTGYPIAIGGDEGSATMETVIHLSVLTDPAAGNEFGVETAGRLGGEPIVTLAAGVRLTARQAIADGDPFAAFDVLYTYELRFPMFTGSVGDADYEDDGSPIGSSAGAVDC